jgi:hypothetical protein
MKRFECVLENKEESRSETVITNADTLGKGSIVEIKGLKWKVKVSLPADTNKVQFGDILHEVKTKQNKY